MHLSGKGEAHSCSGSPIPNQTSTAGVSPASRREVEISSNSVERNFQRKLDSTSSQRLSTRVSTSPPFNPPPRQPRLSVEQQEILDLEVHNLLQKRVIEEYHNQGGFYSSPFIVPKKDGGWRTIINLKRLNRHLRVQHFKMESIYSVRDVLHRGDWMAKLDLLDAYLTVPIFHPHRRFLRFQWRAQAYQFQCLPLGLATAPRVFTKLLRPVVTSTQRIEFLGFKVDSNTMHLYLPHKKLEIRKECKSVRAQGHLTVRRLAHLIGLLTSTIPAVLPAPLHYRALQRLKGKALRNSRHCYNTVIPLDEGALKDLDWWIVHATGSNSKPIKLPKAERMMESDASTTGWGASCQGVQTGGPWDQKEAQMHINWLELKAAFLALETLQRTGRTCMS